MHGERELKAKEWSFGGYARDQHSFNTTSALACHGSFNLTPFQHHFCTIGFPNSLLNRNQHHFRTTCTSPCDVLLVLAPLQHHLSTAMSFHLPQVDFKLNVTPFPHQINTPVSYLNTTSAP